MSTGRTTDDRDRDSARHREIVERLDRMKRISDSILERYDRMYAMCERIEERLARIEQRLQSQGPNEVYGYHSDADVVTGGATLTFSARQAQRIEEG